MSDSRDKLITYLNKLHLSHDEATIYIELLQGPTTHLKLHRDTGIARTKIYRLVDQLEKRSLITHRTDDRGMFIVANDPANLEIEVIKHEEQAKRERETFAALLPNLANLQNNQDDTFVIHTYEGERGFRQMLWHDLKAKPSITINAFGGVPLESFVSNHGWVERYRALSAEAGHKVRDIINTEVDLPTFSQESDYMNLYECRGISRKILPFSAQMAVYEDTVSIYHYKEEKKVGVEIINQGYANMIRAVFEMYWQLAKPIPPIPPA